MAFAALDIEQNDFSDEFTCAADVGMGWGVDERESEANLAFTPSEWLRMTVMRDDPTLVSDGDALWSTNTVASLLRDLYKRQSVEIFSNTTASLIVTHLVGSQQKGWPYTEIASWSKFLNAVDMAIPHCTAVDVIVGAARAAEKWSRIAWWHEPKLVQVGYNQLSLKHAASGYYALLGDMLTELRFVHDPPYEDSLGGQVVDFVREHDRITLILQDDVAQVMTHLADRFNSETFEGLEKSKVAVLDYISALVA